ncbi:hypothetical protein AAC387_Pa03g3987 [Persea americana]
MAVKVFLLLILFYGILSLTQSVNPGECYGRWIYIRNFTSCFNVDLLAHYSNDPIYHDFCPYITNRALGPRTFNGSHSVGTGPTPSCSSSFFTVRCSSTPVSRLTSPSPTLSFLLYCAGVIFPVS